MSDYSQSEIETLNKCYILASSLFEYLDDDIATIRFDEKGKVWTFFFPNKLKCEFAFETINEVHAFLRGMTVYESIQADLIDDDDSP